MTRRIAGKYWTTHRQLPKLPVFEPVAEFWRRVNKTETCWLWFTGDRGSFWDQTRIWAATHYAWMLEYGPVPKGLFVLHSCDVPACVRVSHLFLGTQKDNVRDAVKKGRLGVGEKNGSASTTWETVDMIRAYHAAHPELSLDKLARYFELHRNAIHRIIRLETWKPETRPS